MQLTLSALNFLATLFVLVIGIGALVLIILYLLDVSQSRNAIRRNFPVIGRFRDLFIHLGEFFRQYFFALDREEMPFNRAERDWIYKSASSKSNTEPFGSTRPMTVPGTPIFVNAAFPPVKDETRPPTELIFGPDCPKPYRTNSLINISGMSFGALSKPAIEAFSKGAKKAGCWLNTGEGGLSPHHLSGGCDVIFQIGTAKYGVRDETGRLWDEKLAELCALTEVKMVEIKLAQGAKPGKGGILPGHKVTEEIAAIRGIPVGEDCISPNRHLEAGSADELLDFIAHVRGIVGKPVGIKTVMGGPSDIDALCEAIVKRGEAAAPDFITLDGGDGGTGAAPLALMDNTGLSIREALPLLIDRLNAHGLRQRIRVIASGKLVTPAEVAWAYCAGTDVVNSARGFMFSIGCIQAMTCHTNTCPTGVTTHKAHLQKGLDPEVKSEGVAHFVKKMHKDVAMIAHSCGVSNARDLERHHVRIVQPDGRSRPMSELWPG